MFLEDSVWISRQCSQIPCIRPNDLVFRPDVHQSSNICPDDVIYRPNVQLSKASFARTTRTFRSDLPLCQEASNCSILHPFGRFSSTSGWHSVFDQLWDFLPKHRYGKIAATVRTMWIPIWMRSSIRQVAHSKFKRPDVNLYGPDEWAIYMEIVCIKSTVRTTIPLVRTREASIWKLRTAEVRPSGCQGNTVRMRLKSGKNFSKILESRSHSCPSGRLMSTVQTTPRFYQARRSVELAAYK
jgi:hypothetical protein